MILQLIDDHSRYAVASHVAGGETAEAAIAVFDKAIATHGVPQRLLSDNGVALNPSRRGYLGPTRRPRRTPGGGGDHRQALQADHPGQERTLPPDPVPLPRQAATRRHRWPNCKPRSTRSTTSTTPSGPTKGCPDASRRWHAWEATPKADPPRPKPDRPSTTYPARAATSSPEHGRATGSARRHPRQNRERGRQHRAGPVAYKVDVATRLSNRFSSSVMRDRIIVTDLHGEVLAEHTRPAPGIRYVGNRRPRGPRPKTAKPSPKS